MRNLLLPFLLATSLSACVSLGSKPPERLLSLTSQSSLDAGTSRTAATGRSLIVAIPETPRVLETNRIPVQIDEVSIAYVKDGQWVDKPARLFQRLLSETIAAKTDRVLLDPGQFSGDPGTRLEGELLQFGVDARTDRATVTYDATLLAPDGSAIMKKRFSANQPVAKVKPAQVGKALNDASNDVAAQVAGWIAEH